MNPHIVELAKSAAKLSIHQHRLAAVIFKGKKVISIGYNSTRLTSKIHSKYKQYLEQTHAEQSAILGAPRRLLKGSSILVIRLQRNGKLRLSYPCDMCMPFIRYVRLKWLYYSDNDGNIIKEKIEWD